MGKGSRQLKLWKQDTPEPDWYSRCPDPLHRVSQGCEPFENLVATLRGKIKEWFKSPNGNLEKFLSAQKKEWLDSGGDKCLFDSAFQAAYSRCRF